MPDKPLWFDRLPEVIGQLELSAEPFIDRPTLESLLHVGRRRAQQLLAQVATHRVGTSLVARRTDVIAHFKGIAAGEEAHYEGRRQRQLWDQLEQTRQEWLRQPPVLVEVSQAALRRVEVLDFDGLPEGVALAPGSITVSFSEPEQALQKLMALAIAISRNRDAFDQRVRSNVDARPRPQW